MSTPPVQRSRWSWLGLACLCAVTACSAAACSADGGRVGAYEPGAGGTTAAAGASAAGGAGGAGGSAGSHAGSGGIDGSNNALHVRIADQRQMTIEIVTLACAGDCADIEAVAYGGVAPYSYRWEDGGTNPKRHVCLDADAMLSVTATDTASPDLEFGHDMQTAQASVSARVLDCQVDQPPGDAPCIVNPSFEGVPGINQSASGIPAGTPGTMDVGFQADPWTNCDPAGSPDVWDQKQTWSTELGAPAASDGATYLVVYNVLGNRESAGQQLCTPLVAGKQYSFAFDTAFRSAGSFLNSAAGALQIWAGSASCAEDQLLITSPIATSDWQTSCISFKAEQAFEYLRLVAAPGDGITGVFVDNIRPVASCPSGSPATP